MRTLSAVTDPLLAAGPNATTQSPTARSLEVADCVVVTVVLPDVVSFRFCVLGAVRFSDPSDSGRGKLPGDKVTPDTDSVDPLTAVTLPDAIAKSPNRFWKLPPENFGGLPSPLLVAEPLPR
jgi:hypothetical protein